MLYNEFLNGTNASDNLYTYSEYKRIECIYNNDNSMDKSDAYAMYQPPSGIIAELLKELDEARTQAREAARTLSILAKAHEELKEDYRKEHSARVSLQATMEEARKQLSDTLYTLTD